MVSLPRTARTIIDFGLTKAVINPSRLMQPIGAGFGAGLVSAAISAISVSISETISAVSGAPPRRLINPTDVAKRC